MKFLAFITTIIILILNCSLKSQTNYNNGNEAYINEKDLGFNPVTIYNGVMIYTYDNINKVYQSGNFILIPDLTTVEDGNKIDKNTFFGYDIGGTISDTSFNFDKNTILTQSDFDVSHMFVSPLSNIGMSFAQAVQNNSAFCNYGSCYAVIDGPDSTLAYPQYAPLSDTFDIWLGGELIDAGDLKNTGLIQKVSQQQMQATTNMSYCVNKYGEGWRLPTDIEVGHFNDNEGINNGLDSVYMGVSAFHMWTSSLYKIYTVKRWAVLVTTAYWENCEGFVYVNNKVRCVFPSVPSLPVSEAKPKDDTHIIIYPNPCNNILNINNIENADVSIYDMYAHLLLTDNSKDTWRSINISGLSDGIYIMHIKFKDNFIIKKIIKNGKD